MLAPIKGFLELSIPLVLLFLIFPSGACSNLQGTIGQECFPNKTCNTGLECHPEGICVPTKSNTDGGQEPISGDAGSTADKTPLEENKTPDMSAADKDPEQGEYGNSCSANRPCKARDRDGKRLVCDPSINKCSYWCLTNLDCNQKDQVCLTNTGLCEGPSCSHPCSSATDCTGGQSCENGCCLSSSFPSCKSNNDCQQPNGKSVCRNQRCTEVECTQDNHCAPPNPSCNLQTNTCIGTFICKTDADCKDLLLSRCDPTANGGKGICRKGLCAQCSTDDECGPAKDLCVGQDKGLKDGKRCLRECATSADCPTGFICSDAILSGFKICFPPKGFCEDPCAKITCKDTETCIDGVCKSKPGPCVDCSKDGAKACEVGAECLTYPNSQKFCGKKCTTRADCPTDAHRGYECINKQCLAVNGCQ